MLIKFNREKKKRPDLNSIYEHFCKSGGSNISKDTIHSIISELIKQNVLENKKSAYGDAFRIIGETDIKSSEQLTFCNINDNCDHQSNQDDSGTSIINLQPFTVEEQDVTPPPSPTNEITPEITLNVNTPLPQNKSNISFEEHQQFIYRIEAQMSALKSHMKCELSTMSSKIDSLSEFVNTKINNLNDQQKFFETLRENIKLLQMELQTKNDIIKNLLDTQSAVVDSLSHLKDQQNQLTSLEKQQVTDQSNKVSNKYRKNQYQNHQQDNQHQNHRHNNNHKSKHQTHDDIGQQFQKQHMETNQQEKQVCKKLYVGNLNKDITEEDLNQLFGLTTTVYLRQTCSIEMPLDKNTGKSKGFAFLNVPQHVYNELVKLNGIEFQNHFIRIEEARTNKQT